MKPPRFWSAGPGQSSAWSRLLWPAATLFRGAVGVRNHRFDTGKGVVRAPIPVISVGGLIFPGLIDAAEPLWRTRDEPGLETVPDQSDDRFKRAVLQQVPALEITELSEAGPLLSHYVRSPAGTRTLAFLPSGFIPPGPDGVRLTLGLRRPASALYQLNEQVETFTDIGLTPIAPWEADDE